MRFVESYREKENYNFTTVKLSLLDIRGKISAIAFLTFIRHYIIQSLNIY